MFRNKSKGRNYSQNLKLASNLSGVAGMVNIIGILSVGTLTTNVTGHFAFFSEELFFNNLDIAVVSLLYILFFLGGAIVSGLLMEVMSKIKSLWVYTLPISLEIVILLTMGMSGFLFRGGMIKYPILLSCFLLFSMGLQNALVTKISQSVVRTTHLTGLFTDLGLNISQVLLNKSLRDKKQTLKNLRLKLIIIFSFFCGGIIGGFLYLHFSLVALLFPSALLVFALWYDRLLYRYYSFKRKIRFK